MKLSMIGAGRVGSTTLFQLALEGGIQEMAIVDIDKPRAEGEALDITHGLAQSYVRHPTIEANGIAARPRPPAPPCARGKRSRPSRGALSGGGRDRGRREARYARRLSSKS